MKRILILFGIILLLGGIVYVLQKNKKDNSANINRAESNFRINNPLTIGRIILTNKSGARSDLKRTGDHWTINDKYKARQSNVELLLQAIQNQNLDHIPNRAAVEDILKTMATSGIHVEIFDLEGKPLLSYYVGGVTQDEYGTFFLKEGSSQPYCLTLPGFDGSLRPRYAMQPLDWRDVRFWMEDNEKIDSIIVDYPLQHQHAFIAYKKGLGYDVVPLYKTTPIQQGQNTNLVKSYLITLSKLACEDYVNNIPEKDSVLQLKPFMEMRLVYPDKHSRLRFYPVGTPGNSEFSSPYSHYYIDYEGRDFMLAQYEVIKGAFRSYDYFFGR
ncbi:MAG TPA: hypothetical protein VFV79_02810 [Saprospiraceae bacterium]|nr:hypothetical protein [Saprospiraceae bacterium]